MTYSVTFPVTFLCELADETATQTFATLGEAEDRVKEVIRAEKDTAIEYAANLSASKKIADKRIARFLQDTVGEMAYLKDAPFSRSCFCDHSGRQASILSLRGYHVAVIMGSD